MEVTNIHPGLIWQPTWAHLRELHAAVKQSAETLLWGAYSNHSFGQQQEVKLEWTWFFIFPINYYIFHQSNWENFGVLQGHVFATDSGCVAFLVNFDMHKVSTIQFGEGVFQLAPKSISILSQCRDLIFETGKVCMLHWRNSKCSRTEHLKCLLLKILWQINAQHGLRTAQVVQPLNHAHRWKLFKEPIPAVPSKISHVKNQLCEHLSTTKDETDYLWYLSM